MNYLCKLFGWKSIFIKGLSQGDSENFDSKWMNLYLHNINWKVNNLKGEHEAGKSGLRE